MNLYFRFIMLLLTWKSRSRLDFFEEGLTPFRVLPLDLDTNRHMNNGVYFSIMDLARIDLVFRNGLSAIMKKNQWYPVVASQTIRYRRSLSPFEKFFVKTKLLGWDDRFFYIQQSFESSKGIAALAVVKGRFLKKEGGGVSPAEAVQAANINPISPLLPDWVESWTNSEEKSWTEWNQS